MKFDGQNIIFDDDITMTEGPNVGKKLSEVIGELQSKSDRMSSDLKWIYNYGGVGGGAANGGGGSQDSNYILYATLNDVQINGQVISLGSTGTFPLNITVQRPYGATFSANYKVKSGEKILASQSGIVLNIDNGYSFSTNLKLDSNAQIIVEIVDNIYNITKQVVSEFVTEAYKIDISYVDNNNSEIASSELFVSEVKEKGLNARMKYKSVVAFDNISYSLTFNLGNRTITVSDTENTEFYTPIDNSKREGEINIDLLALGAANGWEVSDENSGYYSVSMTAKVILSNQDTEPVTRNLKFNLIPKSLYLLVTPAQGTIYTQVGDSSGDGAYKFTPGYITFNLKSFYGQVRDVACDIYYTHASQDSANGAVTIISSIIRREETIRVYAVNEGWNSIKFQLKYNDRYYPGAGSEDDPDSGYITYWFYVAAVQSNLSYYKKLGSTSGRPGTYNYYRGGLDVVSPSEDQAEGQNRNMGTLRTLAGGNPLKQSVNSNPVILSVESGDLELPTSGTRYSTVIHMGLQYSDINSKDAVILKGLVKSPTSDKLIDGVTIYQDRIQIGSNASGKFSYYFPKSDSEHYDETSNEYHLLSFVSRYMYSSAGNDYFEVSVYVDGVLEGALESYSTTDLVLQEVEVCASNFILNQLEVSYPQPFYEADNVTTKPEDLPVFQYYLQYMYTRNLIEDNKAETFARYKNLLSQCENVDISNSGDVSCSSSVVPNIAASLEVPTLKLVLQDNDGNIKKALDDSYPEDQGFAEYDVAVHWAKSGEELKPVKLPSDFTNTSFSIQMQGSSTKAYKCKNYNLKLRNRSTDDSADRYLFSPNFSLSDPDTFLPEQQFTLKADVNDSSHSNNTSIGKFVNRVTRKFNTDGGNNNSVLSKYIKNCLTGFPVAIFIEYVKTLEGGSTESTCYYQGIYNFNLGRESYYNLGYKDYSVFYNASGALQLSDQYDDSGFLFYRVDSSSDRLKEGLLVAEIQGNNTYFDFSQYDSSILFKTSDEDKEYMFGDIVPGSGITEEAYKTILRNLVRNVSMAGGYLFGDGLLRKRFSNSDVDMWGYKDGYCATIAHEGERIPANQVPNYRKQFKKVLTDSSNYSYVLDENTIVGEADLNQLINLITERTDEVEDQILNKPWIDFRSLSEYYTICMAFGLVDSVQKNMNLKTWNANQTRGKATFYTAFYDMDTSLGISNSGEEVSYIAFSDYWSYRDIVTGDGIIRPSAVTIYRDYSPKIIETGETAGNFYDTPSSYLFAVAKYAKYLSSTNESIGTAASEWPKKLWGKWRASTTNNSDESVGCLSSADHFVDTYFSNNLGSVCPLLISMDYRNKYFVKKTGEDPNKFNHLNFVKFNGTRIHKVREWLSNRLHILDAYFNLPNSNSTCQYYNEDGEYVNVPIGNDGSVLLEPAEDFGSYLLRENPDIVILQDIFAGSSYNQGSGILDFNVTSLEHSPLFINTANTATRYLLGSDSLYNIYTLLPGNSTYSLGGSGLWTTLDSINSFNFRNLSVDSKYLETLQGTGTNSMTVDGKNIKMPSLRTIVLSGPNYSGDLSIDGSKDFINLSTVDVSNTAINLTIRNSKCSDINISKMKNVDVVIESCDQLRNIIFGSGDSNTAATTLKSCTIRPVPAELAKSGLVLNNTKITEFTVENKSNTGGLSKLSIKNDTSLEVLTVTGFASIEVEGCKNLKYIYINEPDKVGNVLMGDSLNSISIVDCGSAYNKYITKTIIEGGIEKQVTVFDPVLRIGSSKSDEGVADLSEFTKLSSIKLSSLNNLVYVALSQSTSSQKVLTPGGMSNNPNLKYLSGKSILLSGPNTFKDSPNFTMLPDEGADIATTFSIRSTVTDLSGTFYCTNRDGKLERRAARAFLEAFRSGNVGNSVTNISYLFYGQSSIIYGRGILGNDLRPTVSTKQYLDFSVFPNVTSADYALAWCTSITAWHSKMFSFGANSSEITIDNITLQGSGKVVSISIPEDVFSPIIHKVSGSFGWYGEEAGTCELEVIEVPETGNNDNPALNVAVGKSEVQLIDIFHPLVDGQRVHPTKVTSIHSIGYKNDNYVVDLTGMFSNMPALEKIDNFFFDKTYNKKADSNSTRLKGLEGLLNHDTLNNLYSVSRFLRVENSGREFSSDLTSGPVNLYNFAKWGVLLNKGYDVFRYEEGDGADDNMVFEKFILKSDFDAMWDIIKSCSSTGISNLFRNCTLVSNTNELGIAGDLSTTNENIKALNNTFNDFGIYIPSDLSVLENASEAKALVKGLYSFQNASKSRSSLQYVDITGDSSPYKVLPKITHSAYTFANMKLAKCLPYNFFEKRVSKILSSCYVTTKEGYEDMGNNEEIQEYINEYGGIPVGSTIRAVDTRTGEVLSEATDSDESGALEGLQGILFPVTITQYNYSTDLGDLRGCFYNAYWGLTKKADGSVENSARSFDPALVDSLPKDSMVISGAEEEIPLDDEEIASVMHPHPYTIKYVKTQMGDDLGVNPLMLDKNYIGSLGEVPEEFIERQVILHCLAENTGITIPFGSSASTEITDAQEVLDGTVEGSYVSSFTSGGVTFANFDIEDGNIIHKLFVAPDVLYGCSSDCRIEGVFDNPNNHKECLTGLIPKNLLKSVKSASLINVFRNLNILPRYIHTNETEVEGVVTAREKVYCYVPSNFTNNTVLDSSFNFHLMVPNAESISGSGDGVREYDKYFVLLKDSISGGVISLRNSLPSVGNTNLIVSFANSFANDYKIHYNIMYDKDTRKEGLDMVSFTKLALDGLISGPLSFFLNGRLFNDGFALDSIKWASSDKNEQQSVFTGTTRVFSGNSVIANVISRNCILPMAIGTDFSNRKIFTFTARTLKLYLLKSQITGNNYAAYTSITDEASGLKVGVVDSASDVSNL